MNLWTYTVRESWRRPGRTLLTLLGITLGLATVVASRLTIHTFHRTYHDLFSHVVGQASLEVTAPGQAGFDGRFASSLASVPGVKAVVPRIQGIVAASGKSGILPIPVLGLDPTNPAAGNTSLREEQPLTNDHQALLEAGLAQALGLTVGEALPLWTPGGRVELRVAGIMQPQESSESLGGTLFVNLGCAQRLFALPHRVNSVQVALAEEADIGCVQTQIAGRLPAGLSIRPPGARAAMAQNTLRASEQGLACLSMVALIAASFVILNTFLLNFSERRRQLAILRTLGTIRTQVMRLLLREALLLGIVGTLAGCVGGVALAALLLRVMAQFLCVAPPAMEFTAGPFVLALLLGPGLSLAAAWLPAWCAGRRQPLEELRQRHGETDPLLPSWTYWSGLLVLACGVLVQIGLCLDWLPNSVAATLPIPTLVLLLVGSVLALPLVITPLLRLVALLPLPVESCFAVQHLLRHRARTGLTAAVLFLALVVALAFGHTVGCIARDLQQWCRQTIVADYIVRGSAPDTTFCLATALPEALADEIAACGDVAAVDKMTFLPAEAQGTPILVLTRTFATDGPLPLDLHEGEALSVRQGLERGEVVLGTGLAQQFGLHRGDTLTLTTVHGPKELRVAGTATEYVAGGMAVYLEWQAAERLFGSLGVHAFLVSTRAAAVPSRSPSLQAFCEQHHLILQSNGELRGLIELLLASVTSVLWGLMALAFVVASLGVVNTLLMNIADQTRELGVLRAIGMKRRQVYHLVLAQALLLGGTSLLPGAIAGTGLAYAINCGGGLGTPCPLAFHFDGMVVGGGSALVLGVTLLAALLPARKAAHLPVTCATQQS